MQAPQKERCRRISAPRGPGLEAVDGVCGRARGFHLAHAGSHKKLTSPTKMKTGRQPNRAISKPAARVPMALPQRSADISAPLAKPRWCSGKCLARILEH